MTNHGGDPAGVLTGRRLVLHERQKYIVLVARQTCLVRTEQDVAFPDHVLTDVSNTLFPTTACIGPGMGMYYFVGDRFIYRAEMAGNGYVFRRWSRRIATTELPYTSSE